MRIVQLSELPISIESLLAESIEEGFRFLSRLTQDWYSAENRFALPGEALLGAFSEERLLGIGGLNQDPYANDPSVGRVRHFYIRASNRRDGVGTALLREIVRRSSHTFRELHLRTDSPEAAGFYERFGFCRVANAEGFTHRLHLRAV